MSYAGAADPAKKFVLSESLLEEGASAYSHSELESTCSKAERERKNWHDFLTRDTQILARPSLSANERATNLEKARTWLHELDPNPAEFYGSGILASQAFVPKKCLGVFNRCLAVMASFLGTPPGESEYTDGVKLKMLIQGLFLGPDSSSRSYSVVVYSRCQDFFDGYWEKLHGQIQFLKPPVLKALTPVDEEGRMRQMVERAR